jgi:mercuric ion transport protein
MEFTNLADKAGALGSLVSAASCPACFPALASLGSAVGLGFLSQYEGLFISTLLPIFASVALVANALGWLRHRNWRRTALGVVGPALVLIASWWIAAAWWTTVLYAGLAFMVATSLWDLFSPNRPRCAPDGCELPAAKP